MTWSDPDRWPPERVRRARTRGYVAVALACLLPALVVLVAGLPLWALLTGPAALAVGAVLGWARR